MTRVKTVLAVCCLVLAGAAATALRIAKLRAAALCQRPPILDENRDHGLSQSPEELANHLGESEYGLAQPLLDYLVTQDPTRSVVISPHAIARGLAVLAAASTNETRAEIMNALHFEGSTDELGLGLKVMDERLRKGCSQYPGSQQGSPLVHFNSGYRAGVSLWFPSGVVVPEKFQDDAQSNYAATILEIRSSWTPATLSGAMRSWRHTTFGDSFGMLAESADPPLTSSITIETGLDVGIPWIDARGPGSGRFETARGDVHPARYATARGATTVKYSESKSVVSTLELTCDKWLVVHAPTGDARPRDALIDRGELASISFEPRNIPVFDLASRVDVQSALETLGVRRIFDAGRAQLGCATSLGLNRIWERLERSDHVRGFIQTARLAVHWQGVNRPRDEPERSANPAEPGHEIDRPFFVYVWGPGTVLYAAWIADVPR